MPNNPSVTVTIPVHNGADFIGTAVRSALAQTYEPLEVLIVDNASTDETPQIVGAIADERLSYQRFEEFLPVAGSWARALSLAQGDMVMVMSADNEMLPGAIAALVKGLTDEPDCGLALGRVRVEVAPGHSRVALSPLRELRAGVIRDLEAHLLDKGFNFSINAVMFRRALTGLRFEVASGYACDLDLILRLAQEGVRAIAVEQTIHKWLDHPDTLSTCRYDRVWEAMVTAFINARVSSRRYGRYGDRIGRMLVWECMLLSRRGQKDQARLRFESYGPYAAPYWRLFLRVMLRLPGAHYLPHAIRWASFKMAQGSRKGSSGDATASPA